MSELKLVSIVIPIYFEEQLLPELFKRLISCRTSLEKQYRVELVFVNDGSTDKSLELLKSFAKDHNNIQVLDLSRNFGHQLAISAGIDHAHGDAVVVMDGDLQDPPEVIHEMLVKWQEGYDVVYGVRHKRQGETAFKLLTAKLFYRLLSQLSDVEIPVDAGDFRLMDRRVVTALGDMREESRYIRGMISWLGFRQYGLKYHRDARYAGETKYTLRRMIAFALDGVTSFSERPLYLASYLGASVAAGALCWGSWIVMMRWLGYSNTIMGWPSMIVTILFLGGLQLLCLGIIGQYLARVYRQVKHRPLYVVRRVYGQMMDEQSAGLDPDFYQVPEPATYEAARPQAL